MKTRRHHNNKGLRQIKRGKVKEQVAKIAERLDIPLWSEHEICECGRFKYKCAIWGHLK
jgi:hypothetical protein